MATSDYKTGSPSSDVLNFAGFDRLGPPSTFGGSQAGSDYGFGTPQSLDALMQSAAGGPGAYGAVSGSMPGGMGMTSFDGAYQNGTGAAHASQTGNHTQKGSMAGVDHPRLSLASNGPYASNERRDSELGGSDTTSPGMHVGGGIGDNALASNSNDTLNTQAHGAEDCTRSADGAVPPPWSELKTKAGKERKRLPLACIACRRKKIRCSGEKPACKHCLRSRIPCVYKVTTRKAAPRTDYMAMLDKRLKRMEDRVIRIIPKEEQGLVATTGRSVVKPALPPAPPKASSSKKRGAEQAFGEELDGWAGAKADQAERSSSSAAPAEKQLVDAEEHNLLSEGADKLPSKEIQEHLSEVFFDYVYGQSYHLLHKPSYMRRLAQGTVPPVLMLSVCAISARFSNHPAVRSDPAFLRGEQWAAPAREIALKRYGTPNITILLVYLILGLHEFGTCQGGRSWMFCGMAQRMAYALHLHNDLDHDPKIRRSLGTDGDNGAGELTSTDREIRRRTMWSCFLMDRFTSSGTDRPMFVSEQYIRAQLPIREDYYQMEITGATEDLDGNVPNPAPPGAGQVTDPKANMGVAAYTIRLVSIWGKVVHYLNLGGKDRDRKPMWAKGSRFSSIERELQAWKDSLPEPLVYNSNNLQDHASQKIANQFLYMHIVYNQVILFMHRFALPTPGRRSAFPKDMPTEYIQASARCAHEAANQISLLVHEAMDHVVVAPFAGYCAFFSSTVHINGAFSKNAQLEAASKQNLAWNVKFLTKIKKYWGMFHFVTENLRDLYRRHAEAARSGANLAAHGKCDGDENGEIFQYGDWFDRYPAGVSGTAYEEPSAGARKEPGADAVLGQKSDLQTVEEFFSKLSPPSRAVHAQQQQQQQQKKQTAKKRRASKSEKRALAEAQELAQASRANPQQQPQQMSNDPLTGHPFTHELGDFAGSSIAFPPGYQGPPNPLLASPVQQLSQLDRQMVLNSYAGIDSAAFSGFTPQPQQIYDSGNQTENLDPFGLEAFAGNHHGSNGQSGGGLWGDPSTAWFMPFNLDPPTVGRDNNLFTDGNFDWASLNGFGDLGTLPPTGLTPAPVDPDGGHGGLGAEEIDGFERMQ